MRAAIGNQCIFVRRGVTHALFSLKKKNTLAAAFWISYRGLTVQAGRPALVQSG